MKTGRPEKQEGDTVPNQIRYNKHVLRKNNDLVAAMYALYLTGQSLEQVGEVYKRTRQAVYDVFRTRGYLLRSKKKYPELVIDGIKFTPSHRGGYWRATFRNRSLFLSHYVWEKHHGPVPVGWGVHNKDLNKDNCAIENLELLSVADISSKYNPHLNQFTSPNGSRVWRKGYFGRSPRYAKSVDKPVGKV